MRTLGHGGAAVVYLARQESLDRLVAVKLLRSDVADAKAWRRFRREAQTIARLSAHRNVMTIYTAGRSAADEPYLVTEYLDRGSLADIIAAEGQLPADLVAKIGVAVGDALAAAHGEGILHRDVKPGNVLLGHDGRIKLGDFGIARLLGVSSATTDVIAFTPEHVAPEVVRGERDGPSSDLYGLASTLAAALLGESLFSRRPDEQMQAMLSRKVMAPAPMLPSTVPAALAEPISCALDSNPLSRPTLEEFNQQLAAAAQGFGATVALRPPRLDTLPTTVPVAEASTAAVDNVRSNSVRRPRRIWMVIPAMFVALSAAMLAVIVAMDDGGQGGGASTATTPVVDAPDERGSTAPRNTATTPRTAVTQAPTTVPPTTLAPSVVPPVLSTNGAPAPTTAPPPTTLTPVIPAPLPDPQPATPPAPNDGSALLLTAPEAETFMRTYYDEVAAGDYEASWAKLALQFQQGKARSYEYYVGFWEHNDIEVDDVTLVDANENQAIVHVTLRWNGSAAAVTDEFTIRAGNGGDSLISRQRAIDGD